MIKVAPSILSADFSNLGHSVQLLKSWNADWVHFDVMDGHFVPNITFGPAMCKAVRPYTDLPLDVHLMVTEPDFWIEPFANAGADIITIHAEANGNKHSILQKIHTFGKKAGIVINPETPVDTAFPFLESCDLVLLMSVHPGFGGQSFIENTVEKISSLKSEMIKRNLQIEIEVDGGINPKTAILCKNAGATVLVAGSSVFHSDSPESTIKQIKE